MAVGFVSPESFGLALSLAFLVGIVIGGLASIGGVLFGALFIEFMPNYADQLTVYFGENAKALPGAVYGLLMILMMAAAPKGVAGLLASLSRVGGRGSRGAGEVASSASAHDGAPQSHSALSEKADAG